MVCNYYMVLARIKVNMSENVLEIKLHVWSNIQCTDYMYVLSHASLSVVPLGSYGSIHM